MRSFTSNIMYSVRNRNNLNLKFCFITSRKHFPKLTLIALLLNIFPSAIPFVHRDLFRIRFACNCCSGEIQGRVVKGGWLRAGVVMVLGYAV